MRYLKYTHGTLKYTQGSTSSLVKEDESADATYQYTDFGETTIQGDDQAKMKCVILVEFMIRVRGCTI